MRRRDFLPLLMVTLVSPRVLADDRTLIGSWVWIQPNLYLRPDRQFWPKPESGQNYMFKEDGTFFYSLISQFHATGINGQLMVGGKYRIVDSSIEFSDCIESWDHWTYDSQANRTFDADSGPWVSYKNKPRPEYSGQYPAQLGTDRLRLAGLAADGHRVVKEFMRPGTLRVPKIGS